MSEKLSNYLFVTSDEMHQYVITDTDFKAAIKELSKAVRICNKNNFVCLVYMENSIIFGKLIDEAESEAACIKLFNAMSSVKIHGAYKIEEEYCGPCNCGDEDAENGNLVIIDDDGSEMSLTDFIYEQFLIDFEKTTEQSLEELTGYSIDELKHKPFEEFKKLLADNPDFAFITDVDLARNIDDEFEYGENDTD